jgi:hypothetical protein
MTSADLAVLPTITPQLSYLPNKVIATLRMQDVLSHIVPQVEDYLGEKGGKLDLFIDSNDSGDLFFTFVKSKGL